MATIVCVNRVAASAFRGEAALCTLNGSDSVTQIPQLIEGQQCIITSSGAKGTVTRIDTFGHTFNVKPNRPEQTLGTGTAPNLTNTFAVNDSVTVTL